MFPGIRERVYLEQIGLCLSLVTFYGNVFICIYELLVGRRVAKKVYVQIIRVGMRVAQKCIFMHKGLSYQH